MKKDRLAQDLLSGRIKLYEADNRQSKAEASYQDHASGSNSCAKCEYFSSPDDCSKVKGKISPKGWCAEYKKG